MMFSVIIVFPDLPSSRWLVGFARPGEGEEVMRHTPGTECGCGVVGLSDNAKRLGTRSPALPAASPRAWGVSGLLQLLLSKTLLPVSPDPRDGISW